MTLDTDKVRAVSLAALVVFSAFAGTVAFVGAASATTGSVSVDASFYDVGDTVSITVSDSDLNSDTSTAESTVVDVTSTTEGQNSIAGEDVADGTTSVTTGQPVADRNDDNQITGADITYNDGGTPSGGISSVSRNSDGTVTLTLLSSSDSDDTIDYTAGESHC